MAKSEQDIIEQIEALLRQAESSEFPEERDAFYAGARRLMVKHAIDEAALNTARGTTEEPESEHFQYSPNDSWVPGKRQLLAVACEMAGSGTQFVYYTGGIGPSRAQYCDLIGYQAERAVAKAAYASLYLQARQDASKAGFSTKKQVTSFMVGYAQGVLQKVIAARIDEEATLEPGTAIVLRDRSLAVKEMVEEMGVASAPKYSADPLATVLGEQAGRRADLITQERLG